MKVLSPCGFNLPFPREHWCWAPVCVLVCHAGIFFGEMSAQVFFFACFLKFVVLFSYCWIFIALHVLQIQVYCGLCDVQIFSLSLSWSFHSLNRVMPRAKVFNFWNVSFTYIYVYFFVCLFVLGPLGVVPKNSLPDLRSQRFSPLLSWRSFIIDTLHASLWYILSWIL